MNSRDIQDWEHYEGLVSDTVTSLDIDYEIPSITISSSVGPKLKDIPVDIKQKLEKMGYEEYFYSDGVPF